MENEKTKERNIETYILMENKKLFLGRMANAKTVEERRFEISLARGFVSTHPIFGCVIQPEEAGYERPYLVNPAQYLDKPKLVAHRIYEH